MILFILTFIFQLHSWTLLGPNVRGWANSTVTFGVNYENCPVEEEYLNEIIDKAMDLWNSVPTSKLKLKRTTSTTTVAQFISRTASDAPVFLCDPDIGTSLSVDADYIPGAATGMNDGILVYGGLLLNAQNGALANIANLTRTELEIVVVHELGHVLGLGHSSDTASMMYFSIGGKSEAIVTQDDMDGINYLYPKNEFHSGQFGCAAVHPGRKSNIILMGFLLFFPILLRRLFFRLPN